VYLVVPPHYRTYDLELRSRFRILGGFLTDALALEAFSIRPLRLVVLPDLLGPAHTGSGASGIELGWHSSNNIARSGALLARHCSRTRACRCRLRIVCDDSACASRLRLGRGEDVVLRSVMLRLKREGDGSKSE